MEHGRYISWMTKLEMAMAAAQAASLTDGSSPLGRMFV
jgi:hypothetical protein